MPKGIPKNGINKGWFEKGFVPWNFGLKNYMIPWNKGKRFRAIEGEKNPAKRLEVRKKISKALKGKKLSDLTRAKISLNLCNQKIHPPIYDKKGKKHWNWQGGITSKNLKIRNSKKMKEWKRKVFEKNNYICQICKQKGGCLEAHHIKSFARFPKLRFQINNGITFCINCHKKFHVKNKFK